MNPLSEIALFTERVEAMTTFYRRVLGQAPLAASADMAIFKSGRTALLIHRRYRPEPGELPPEDHVAFAVADLEAACRALTRAGLQLEAPPRAYEWGHSAYLRDPDGHLIELIESGGAP